MKYRTIKDIRIYESDIQNGNGNGLPKQLGTLFLPSNLFSNRYCPGD
ncbi:hypothetical protein [Sphingobacterium siyangense]